MRGNWKRGQRRGNESDYRSFIAPQRRGGGGCIAICGDALNQDHRENLGGTREGLWSLAATKVTIGFLPAKAARWCSQGLSRKETAESREKNGGPSRASGAKRTIIAVLPNHRRHPSGPSSYLLRKVESNLGSEPQHHNPACLRWGLLWLAPPDSCSRNTSSSCPRFTVARNFPYPIVKSERI